MPAAHLFRVLNVSGATTSASAGGRASRSRGPPGVARATQPVAEEISSRSIQVAAVGVVIRHTLHCLFWSSAMNSEIRRTGGAADATTYAQRCEPLTPEPPRVAPSCAVQARAHDVLGREGRESAHAQRGQHP
jgi:hypothetical protein